SQEGDIILQNGQPEWRIAASVTWRHHSGWGAGARANYTSEFIDTGAGLDPNGDPFFVDAWTQTNAYVQYDIDAEGLLDGMRIRVGANNIFDEDPPLADETNGYDAAYHSIRGRQVYFDVRKRF
ncbi:MAG TPA: TonB-dependent receptor, partial [Oceanicaulis sp.]|nr:TonB-dependent receptor [Oceanicaulis sp.]